MKNSTTATLCGFAATAATLFCEAGDVDVLLISAAIMFSSSFICSSIEISNKD